MKQAKENINRSVQVKENILETGHLIVWQGLGWKRIAFQVVIIHAPIQNGRNNLNPNLKSENIPYPNFMPKA